GLRWTVSPVGLPEFLNPPSRQAFREPDSPPPPPLPSPSFPAAGKEARTTQCLRPGLLEDHGSSGIPAPAASALLKCSSHFISFNPETKDPWAFSGNESPTHVQDLHLDGPEKPQESIEEEIPQEARQVVQPLEELLALRAGEGEAAPEADFRRGHPK
uniref:Uncharacterized protein n=1 Tax=Mustela putorius furo TaxID=9669 RepID=M3Y7B2_MUSPF